MIRANGLTLTPGDTFALSLEFYLDTYKGLTFSTSNEEVLTVTDEGELKALSVGTADITANITVDDIPCSNTATIPVIEALDYDLTSSRTATDIALARVPESIEVGEEFSAQAYLLSAITAEESLCEMNITPLSAQDSIIRLYISCSAMGSSALDGSSKITNRLSLV